MNAVRISTGQPAVRATPAQVPTRLRSVHPRLHTTVRRGLAATKPDAGTHKPAVKVLRSTPEAAGAQLPRILDTLGLALAQDSLNDTLKVAPEKRALLFRGFSDTWLRCQRQQEVLYYSEDGDCACIALTKQQSQGMDLWTLLANGALHTLLTVVPWQSIPKMLSLFAAVEQEEHALEAAGISDYIKVAAVGARPSAQGRGLGSAVLKALSADADAAGVHLYLEASSREAARLYERLGYQLLKTVAPGGKELLLMARPPQPAAPAAHA